MAKEKTMVSLIALVMCMSLGTGSIAHAQEVDAGVQERPAYEESSEAEGSKALKADDVLEEDSENAEAKAVPNGSQETAEQDKTEVSADTAQQKSLSAEGSEQVAEALGTQGIEPLSASSLNNPRVEKDSSMEAGQKVTYDCVWFGNYPQAEVVPSAEDYTAITKNAMRDGDIIADSSLYGKLQGATGWSSNNDITINGYRFHRMKASDATYAKPGTHYTNYYYWADADTWHYFKYEPIKWRVLKTDGNQAFLLSDMALDNQRYNTVSESITWETSTVRSWLNGYGASSNKQEVDYSGKNFISSAFSSVERMAITDAVDKLFLLSYSEAYGSGAKAYGFATSENTYDEARRGRGSAYAMAMGMCWDVYSFAVNSYGNCSWWLRPTGESSKDAVKAIDSDGSADSGRYYGVNNYMIGVRPALTLDLSSDLHTYAGTVCSDGTVREENKDQGNGGNEGGGDSSTSTDTDYESDVVAFMNNKGTLNTIKYLCKDSNFTNSIYVHENDGTFSSTISMILSDVYYRGLDGWKDLFTAATSKTDAEKILAALLQEYQSDVEELAKAKNAEKYASYFIKGLKDYTTSAGIVSSIDNEDVKKLSNIITEEKVAEFLVNGKYETLSAYFQVKGGYSENSEIVKTLKDYMSSKSLANQLSKGLDFLGGGLTVLSLTQDTFNYLYQLESLVDADESYSEMLLYLKDNCCFDVVKDAAADLYNVIHGSCLDQLDYVSTALKDAVADKALDAAVSGAVKALPYGEILKAGFDWGVNISNAIFHIGDTQQLKDSMRTIAYIGNCLSLWTLDNQTNFLTATGEEKNEYARKLYYSLYMLWNTRKVGEETLQSMYTKSYTKWSKFYTLSLQISATLDSFKNSVFTSSMTSAFISVAVSCPVDVQVYDTQGKLITSAKDGKESSGHTKNVYYYVKYQKLDDDYVKILCFPEDCDYTLKYMGKDIGTVDSLIMNITEEGVADRKYFQNVKVQENTVIVVNSISSDSPAYSVTNASGGELEKGTFLADPDTYIPVVGIELPENKCQLTIGEKKLITASILPQDAANKKVLWSSSNESVLEINSEGVITAKAEGKCSVQCTTAENSAIYETIEIEVVKNQGGSKEPYPDNQGSSGDQGTLDKTGSQSSGNKTDKNESAVNIVKISKIKLSGISKKVSAGKKIKLTANVTPSDAANKSVKWKSSNKKVATVNSKGVVTMKKKSGGKKVTITATATDGSNIKATYKIISMKGVVKKVVISGKKTVKAGKPLKLKAKVTASKKANTKLKWTSSNTKYATVSNSGKVKTKKAGRGKKVKITAMATDGSGKKKTVTIKIK